jgi:hypothetical protein
MGDQVTIASFIDGRGPAMGIGEATVSSGFRYIFGPLALLADLEFSA